MADTQIDLRDLARERPPEPGFKPGRRRPWITRYVVPTAVLAGFASLMAVAVGDHLLPRHEVTVVPVVVTRAQVQREGTPLFQAAGWIEPRPTAISVPPKQATNMALVINELTTNTIKYALDDRTSAKITVRIILESDNMVRFEFHNDGADYPPEVLSGDRRNLGLYLVQTLVERGLGGTLELRNDHGPVTIIRFRRG